MNYIFSTQKPPATGTHRFLLNGCVIIAAVLAFISSAVGAEPPLFVFTGPTYDGTPAAPHTAIIFCVNSSAGKLEPVWSLPEKERPLGMRLYDNEIITLMVSRNWLKDNIEKMYVFSADSTDRPFTVNLADFPLRASIPNQHFFISENGNNHIELVVKPYVQDGPYRLIDAESGSILDRGQAVESGREMRLAGFASPYYEHSDNIVPLIMDTTGALYVLGGKPWQPQRPLPPVPTDIIKLKPYVEWNMFANERDYSALHRIPRGVNPNQLELLIYDKNRSEWNSVLIPGAETRLRLINGWLVGVIADPDPNAHYPSICRQDAVFINPRTFHQFTVHLGGVRPEVLWVDGDEVWYRTGDELYKARIANDDLVDRQLIVKDRDVFMIYWAFRGKVKE